MQKQSIRIVLKAFDHSLIDSATAKIVDIAKRTGAHLRGPVPLPTRKRKFNLLISPHVNKDARPTHFSLAPKKFSGVARLPNETQHMSSPDIKDRTEIPMDLQQLPVVSNTATTGHKLQGSGVDHLFVSEWYNEASWIYVILSRVKTRRGLYLREELRPNIGLHKIPDSLRSKIRHFRANCTRPDLDTNEYNEICAAPRES